MNAEKKLLVLSLSLIAVSFAVSIVFSFKDVKTDGEEKIKQYQEAEISKTKSRLKVLVDVVYTSVDADFKGATSRDNLALNYSRPAGDILDIALDRLRYYAGLAASGKMPAAEARKRAEDEIRSLRYAGGAGFFWITDTTAPVPRVLVHTAYPGIEGSIPAGEEWNLALGNGTNVFAAFREVAVGGGEGFVDYIRPEPAGEDTTVDVPRLAYVRLFKDWGWIVGTDILLDKSLEDMKGKSMSFVRKIKIDGGQGGFFITDKELPLPKLLVYPHKPALEGRAPTGPEYNVAGGQNIFAASLNLCLQQGEGPVVYKWREPGSSRKAGQQSRMTYVKLHEPLGWVIGADVSLGGLDKEVAQRKGALRSRLLWFVLKMSGLGAAVLILGAIVINFFEGRILHAPGAAGASAPGAVTPIPPAGDGQKDGARAPEDIVDAVARNVGNMIEEQKKLLDTLAGLKKKEEGKNKKE